jgi:hypothetical protein
LPAISERNFSASPSHLCRVNLLSSKSQRRTSQPAQPEGPSLSLRGAACWMRMPPSPSPATSLQSAAKPCGGAQPGAALLSSAITPSQLACCVTIACALSLCQFFPGCSARCACNSSSDVWLTNSLFSNVCSCCDSYAARSRERHVPTQKSAKPDGRRDGSESQSSTCLRRSKGRLPLFWPSRTRNGCQKIGRIDDFLRN